MNREQAIEEKRITIFGNKQKAAYKTITTMSIADFQLRITHDNKTNYILRYREELPYYSNDPTSYKFYDRIMRVCPSTEYARSENGHKFKAYTGIIMIEVDKANSQFEIDQIKYEASLIPQTLMAFTGCSGRSVKIWALATLPNGSLPQTEEEAELFHAQAYRIAVQCYAPTLTYTIDLKEPRLSNSCMMTVDNEPYINPHPTPFIIEQPTAEEVVQLTPNGDFDNPLYRIKPGTEGAVTLRHMFNAAYRQALIEVPAGTARTEPMRIIPIIAEYCAEQFIPEEEATNQIICHFRKEDTVVVRGMVHNIYTAFMGKTPRNLMPKKQIAALQISEFMKRRYDVRFNEVLGVTEYRPRQSLYFMYKELTKRDLNTIRHEAALEGIEAFDSEISGYINSNNIPTYNPIEEYLENLGRWDGKDYIREVARLVPCNNPKWPDLFYRWFLSMVAHWMNIDKEHGNNTAPILIGGQGYRKSTFCRILLPPELRNYFTDSLDFRNNTEAERYLSRFLLVNIDEFDQLSENQFAFIKHLFQKPVVNIRRSYSTAIESLRRYASFIGTSNQQEILRDPTGNRRYLCIEVTAPIQVEKPINYQQLYAQAFAAIASRERYWMNDEEEELIKSSNKSFEKETPLEQLLLMNFRQPENNEEEWYRPMELMNILRSCKGFSKTMDSVHQLGRILVKLKIEKKRKTDGYYYKLTKI